MSQHFTISPYTSPTATNKFLSSGLLLLFTLVYSLLLLAHNFCYSWSFSALRSLVLLPLFFKVFVVVFNRNCDLSNLIPFVLVERSSCSLILELPACPWSVYIQSNELRSQGPNDANRNVLAQRTAGNLSSAREKGDLNMKATDLSGILKLSLPSALNISNQKLGMGRKKASRTQSEVVGRDMWELPVLAAQFFCNSKTVLKIKSLIIFLNNPP